MLSCAVGMTYALTSPHADDIGAIMDQSKWVHRVVVIFTPNADHHDYHHQINHMNDAARGLKERDIVVWRVEGVIDVIKNNSDRPTVSATAMRDYFDVPMNDVTIILIGKDGHEKLREMGGISIQTLFDTIDAMPMRQREMSHDQKE